MSLTQRLLGLSPLFLGLTVLGCSGGGSGGGSASAQPASTSSGGELTVLVTDAPLRDLSGVSKAEITVDAVWIHAASAPGSTASTSSGSTTSTGTTSGSTSTSTGTTPTSTTSGSTSTSTPTPTSTTSGSTSTAPAVTGSANAHGNNPNAFGAASQGQSPNAGHQNPTAIASSGATPGANSQGGNGTGNGNGLGGSFISIFDAASAGGPKVFNLLDLRGGIMAELANANLPAGKYTHLRLELSAAEVELNGTSYSTQNGLLTLPSGKRSELIIPFQGSHTLVIQQGQPAQGLVDFDLSRSFNVIGNPASPSRIQMSPVVRGANLKTSGNLAGVVLSDALTPADTSDDVPLANATVTVTQQGQASGGQPVSITTYTDAQGAYYVPGLADGAWDVLFQATDHDDQGGGPVTIASGQQATLDATLVKK